MTLRVEAVLKEIENQLPGIVFRTGAKLLAQHDRPPRIVWVTTRDAFLPAVKHGTNPRSLRTRVAGVEAHVWGPSLRETETMVHNLVVALHRVAHGSYELRGCQWDQPMWMDHGEACVVSFELAIPISTEIEPLALIENIEARLSSS